VETRLAKLYPACFQASPQSRIHKRSQVHRSKEKINELRDYYCTFMVKHGLIREEVDLLQGRIPPSIFIRHYWSPSFKELRDRTLEAINLLEQSVCLG